MYKIALKKSLLLVMTLAMIMSVMIVPVVFAEGDAEATPEPTAEATPEPTAEATPEPTAEATPEPTAEATPEPTAEATPEPTVTPELVEKQYNAIEGLSATEIKKLDFVCANLSRRLVVTYKSAYSKSAEISNMMSGYMVMRKTLSPYVETISVAEGIDINKTIAELKNNSNVYSVEIDGVKSASDDYTTMTTNDTYYSSQWYLSNIKAEYAWNAFTPETGKTVVVAVLDTGLQTDHVDMIGRVASGGKNFTDSTLPGVTDTDGHGTFCCSEIAARTNNSAGIASITKNFSVKVLPIKVLNDVGDGYDSWIAAGIDYAVSQGVEVISMSLGGEGQSTAIQAAINRAHNAGITVVAASGNGAQYGNPIEYPAAGNYVISVSAYGEDNKIADFSTHNQYVDIAAPGVNIVGAVPTDSYAMAGGTSMACPIVAAAAAMLKLQDTSRTPAWIENRLKSTATDRGTSGKDNYFGYGALNMQKALAPIDDHGNYFANATKVSLGNKAGNFETTADVDMFKFVPTASGNYIFQTTGSVVNTFGQLYDANKTRILYNYDGGSGSNFKMTKYLAANKTYYIKVARQTGAIGGYTLSITKKTVADDHGNYFANATKVSLGNKAGKFETYGDVDMFKFVPTASGNYIIQTTGSTVDTYGQLYDANKTRILYNYDGGAGSNFKMTKYLAANKTYYIKVARQKGGIGSYTLSIAKKAAADDHGNYFANPTKVSLGNKAGKFETYSDVDMFKFVPTTSGSYIIQTTGTIDTYGQLYDANKTRILYNYDGGTGGNFKMTKYLAANKTYYIKVARQKGGIGSYTLNITKK